MPIVLIPGTETYIPKSHPGGGQTVYTPLDAHEFKRAADLIDCASEAAYNAALAHLMPLFMKASPEELPELQEKVLLLADRHLLALQMSLTLRESGRAQSAPGSA